MERFKIRFERKNGHFLVLEGDPPLTRGDCDVFQLNMLKSCEVPGLLKPAMEEMDGSIAFRYPLQGTRMLSQALRAEKWSMESWMTAICRLTEVWEECRHYVLDPERILLEEDRIFVGDGWHDLRFVYVPVQRDRPWSPLGMESLMIRWMLHVDVPDGPVVQQLLRMTASPDFKPSVLRSFARRYLAGKAGGGMPFGGKEETASSASAKPAGIRLTEAWSEGGLMQSLPPTEGRTSDRDDNRPGPSGGWRWFQPQREESHALSGLLGDDPLPLPATVEPAEPPLQQAEEGKSRIWIVCAAGGVAALGWRFGFAMNPTAVGLGISVGITVAAAAGACWMWIRGPRVIRGRDLSSRNVAMPDEREAYRPHDASDPPDHDPHPALEGADRYIRQNRLEMPSLSETAVSRSWEEDRTGQLDILPGAATEAEYYLEWLTAASAAKIFLRQPSLVIGRSREAAGHVDETPGISRAHAELLLADAGWTAKDLGSRNGSRLNGVPMVPYEPCPLKEDDILEFAGSRYRFRSSING